MKLPPDRQGRCADLIEHARGGCKSINQGTRRMSGEVCGSIVEPDVLRYGKRCQVYGGNGMALLIRDECKPVVACAFPAAAANAPNRRNQQTATRNHSFEPDFIIASAGFSP